MKGMDEMKVSSIDLGEFEVLDGVHKEESLLVMGGWDDGTISKEYLRVNYVSINDENVILFSSIQEKRPRVYLTERKFMTVLTYLAQKGLFENVGAVVEDREPTEYELNRDMVLRIAQLADEEWEKQTEEEKKRVWEKIKAKYAPDTTD